MLDRDDLRSHSYLGGVWFLHGQSDSSEEFMGDCGTAGSRISMLGSGQTMRD